jgi:transposase InsO family protein
VPKRLAAAGGPNDCRGSKPPLDGSWSDVAFPREAAAAFPFRLTHVLTDNGSCFTPRFARACAELSAEHRHTRPRSPHANGMVERFDGRVGGEVLGITT